MNLDLADRTFEFGDRNGLAVTLQNHLDLAREDQLAEAVRGEVVRIGARVLQHELVELAGFEPQLVGQEGVLPGLAQFHDDFDRLLPR